MINRRAAIGAVLGAPLAAKAKLESGVSGQVVGAVNSVKCGQPEVDQVWELFRKHSKKFERRREINRRQGQGFHHSVAAMKSWSPAFRAHVQEQIEGEELDFWDMSREEQAAWLFKRGVSV